MNNILKDGPPSSHLITTNCLTAIPCKNFVASETMGRGWGEEIYRLLGWRGWIGSLWLRVGWVGRGWLSIVVQGQSHSACVEGAESTGPWKPSHGHAPVGGTASPGRLSSWWLVGGSEQCSLSTCQLR